MFRPAWAFFALLSALLAYGGPASAQTGFAAPKGFASRGAFASVKAPFGRHWPRLIHKHRRGLRPAVPVFLAGRDDGSVFVHVEQNVVTGSVLPSLYAIPSVADLPVSTGIREARPSQAAIYVLNEDSAPARDSSRTGPRSPGARIITLADRGEDWAGEAAPDFGARIIHLTVPVGRTD